MMECNYISLSEADMANHYLQCDGVSYENYKNEAAVQRVVVYAYALEPIVVSVVNKATGSSGLFL
jgi:hypothetical protein